MLSAVVKIPVVDFPGSFTRPAFCVALAIPAFSRPLAMRALFLVRTVIDILFRIVDPLRFPFARPVAEGAFPRSFTVGAYARLNGAKRALFPIIMFRTFFIPSARCRNDERSETRNKIPAIHDLFLSLSEIYLDDLYGRALKAINIANSIHEITDIPLPEVSWTGRIQA